MSIQSIQEFFEAFCGMLIDDNSEMIPSIYHMPCIMMDRYSFAPCSNSIDIAEFNREFVRLNVLKYQGTSLRPIIKSVKKLSPSLLLVNVVIEVLGGSGEVLVNSINLNYNIMDLTTSHSIVVMETLSSEIPKIERLVRYKAEELEDAVLKGVATSNLAS